MTHKKGGIFRMVSVMFFTERLFFRAGIARRRIKLQEFVLFAGLKGLLCRHGGK
jgi:hypothetical protein